ncbi:sulfurtransferase complex subunit TusD [Aliikangiella marina]|uniref:Sulfurtransferase complex subunit TusD n=1 Tax=Aliikangiella marina TaxID=1712262 RepID=A0A545THD0_9GAMM|nr:sulfurtransferase complex subunit TusD [Aliikangiella marina]TQV76633.1 sulfurtransferase complex subunit TusD [Aliikangiella marina]
MAKFTLLVTGSHSQSQAHHSAIRFIRAVIESGNEISSVFFYQEAVTIANRYLCIPQDETQLTDQWVKLAEAHNFELQVCVAASNRRGVINEEEAKMNGKVGDSIDSAFAVLGLGQLAAAMSNSSSRLIHFK